MEKKGWFLGVWNWIKVIEFCLVLKMFIINFAGAGTGDPAPAK